MHRFHVLLLSLSLVAFGTAANLQPAYMKAGGLSKTPCVFSGTTGYAELKNRNQSCSNIVIKDLSVPGGVTLDLRNLASGTTVREHPIPLESVPCNGLTRRSRAGA